MCPAWSQEHARGQGAAGSLWGPAHTSAPCFPASRAHMATCTQTHHKGTPRRIRCPVHTPKLTSTQTSSTRTPLHTPLHTGTQCRSHLHTHTSQAHTCMLMTPVYTGQAGTYSKHSTHANTLCTKCTLARTFEHVCYYHMDMRACELMCPYIQTCVHSMCA